MKIPKSYRSQNSCANCKHSFQHIEYDEGEIYYCMFDGEPRPLSGSVAMDENWGELFKGERYTKNGYTKKYETYCNDAMKKWHKWESEHGVAIFGICDEWKLK